MGIIDKEYMTLIFISISLVPVLLICVAPSILFAQIASPNGGPSNVLQFTASVKGSIQDSGRHLQHEYSHNLQWGGQVSGTIDLSQPPYFHLNGKGTGNLNDNRKDVYYRSDGTEGAGSGLTKTECSPKIIAEALPHDSLGIYPITNCVTTGSVKQNWDGPYVPYSTNASPYTACTTIAKFQKWQDLQGVHAGTFAPILNNKPCQISVSFSTLSNSPPIANAGPNKIITRDDILSGKQTSVTFDGCASSDPDNDPLTYSWSLTKPNPDLIAPESPVPICNPYLPISLTPADDDFGTKLTYKLVVNDGKIDSNPASVDVTVCPRHDDRTPDGKCNLPKIDVRAVPITDYINVRIYHLFIIYTDENGINYLFRAGPSGPFPHYGTIQGYNAVYANGGPDWDLDAPSVTVMKGSAASGKNNCFVSQLSRITTANIPYHLFGPNSNTVTKTLLVNCGIPVAKPVNLAPGWDLPPL